MQSASDRFCHGDGRPRGDDSRIRVLFLSYQSRRNGAPRSLLGLVKYLDRTRFEPLVVFNTEGPIVEEFGSIAPVQVLGSVDWFWCPERIRGKFRKRLHRRKLRALERSFLPDLIYINTIAESEAVHWALDESSAKKAVHFHEAEWVALVFHGQAWVERLVEKSDLVIGCARAISDFILRCLGGSPERTWTVPEAIDAAELRSRVLPTPREVKRELGFPEDSILIGATGDPSFRKGLDLFVQAAARVRATFSDRSVCFAWVGGDDRAHRTPYVAAMRRLVNRLNLSNCWRWVKEVPDPAAYQAAMDVYVVSSREDPMPLGMLEAMLFGVPLVGFAVNGVPEALEAAGGVLVDRVTPEALAEGILSCLNARDRALASGTSFSSFFTDQFDAAHSSARIQGYIAQLFSAEATQLSERHSFHEGKATLAAPNLHGIDAPRVGAAYFDRQKP